MRPLLCLSVVVAVLTWRTEIADACACCDAKFRRTPIGWTAEGAVLIDAFDTVACDHKRRIEVWTVDARAPDRCFDRYGDPEQPIACEDIMAATARDTWKAKSVAAAKQVATKAVKLAAAKLRVRQESTGDADLTIIVEVRTKTGWQRAWRETLRPSPDLDKVRAVVTVWPSPKDARALVLVDYVTPGTGNRQVDVHWATLPT